MIKKDGLRHKINPLCMHTYGRMNVACFLVVHKICRIPSGQNEKKQWLGLGHRICA